VHGLPRTPDEPAWPPERSGSARTTPTRRDERRIKTSLRLSGLHTGQTLASFDWGFQPGFDQRRMETLSTCGYIREHETILIQGPPGIGKTHLAVALGVRAVECGFSVAFYRRARPPPSPLPSVQREGQLVPAAGARTHAQVTPHPDSLPGKLARPDTGLRSLPWGVGAERNTDRTKDRSS
jgi:hypothetical protein